MVLKHLVLLDPAIEVVDQGRYTVGAANCLREFTCGTLDEPLPATAQFVVNRNLGSV